MSKHYNSFSSLRLFFFLVAAFTSMASSSDLEGQLCPPAVSLTSEFWVSSSATNQIFRFNGAGTPIGEFTLPGLSHPRGISFTPAGTLYIASQFGHEIFVCDTNGTYSHSFSVAGLSGPTGSIIGPNGNYFVCSFNTDSVLEIDASEQLVATYTSPGLNGPNCIVFRPDGGFFVTGQISNDVHSFDAVGNSLGSFPTGQSSVMGANFDHAGHLLVAGGSSNDVRKFDCSGTVIDTWAVAGGPQSIGIRDDGVVFVTTFFTDQVLWFSPDGTLIDSWTGGNQIRGIEFLPSISIEFIRGDSNLDGTVDLADAISTLAVLFSGADPFTCPDAADVNDDGTLTIADPISLLGSLFSGAPDPPAPYPEAGPDPTPDSLDCST